MDTLNLLLEEAVGWIWSTPLILFLLGTGVFLSATLGGPRRLIQWRGFRHAFDVMSGKYTSKDDPGELSHFQALSTALSATLGLGNISGVAIAVSVGGPGATFWMIVTGFIGMATKFAECSLSVLYRKIDDRGVVHGGPMHYIERGLGYKWKPMAQFFAAACMIATLGGADMFQTNQVASVFKSSFGISEWVTGLALAFMTALVIIGGVKRIGQVTSHLIPVITVCYFIGCFVVLGFSYEAIPDALLSIIRDAFTGTAAAGGFAGVATKQVIITGIRRAAFSNEAGLGSSPIAHSTAVTQEPIREGIVALLEPFIDTILMCTLTALTLVVTGAWTQSGLDGAQLTVFAFDHALPGLGRIFVPIAMALFAYATLLSWSYYGERSADYLFGENAVIPYKIIFCLAAFLGAMWKIDAIVNFSDIMYGFMLIPNLIAVILLWPKLRYETKKYFDKLERGEFNSKNK